MQNKPNYATFGPGGNSQSFYDAGLKSTKQAPAWLKQVGLDAYEYEAGNGISAGETALREIGAAAREHGILMSLHTPYFISLSGVDPEKRLKSIDYIAKSLWAAELLGADTIVIHCGSAGKISRAEGMALSADTLYKTLEKLGDTDIAFGVETMGKQNQLGTLDEVIELCKMDARLAPVVDFGHLNARDCGGVFVTADDYRRVDNEEGMEAKSQLSYHPVKQHVSRLDSEIVRRAAYKTEAAHYLAKRESAVKFIKLLVVIKVNAERVCSE